MENVAAARPSLGALGFAGTELSPSSVTWSAVIAGAVATAVMGLLLLTLGSALGLLAVSPWQNEGLSATAFGVGAAIWLIVVQWISAGFGGYLTGRLRTKWVNVHMDEVGFRDTAHGFLSWALATLVTAVLLTSAVSSLAGGGVKAASAVASGAAAGAAASAGNPSSSHNDYLVDVLFRADQTRVAENRDAARAEAGRILVKSLLDGKTDPTDKAYLTQLIAAQTGVSEAEADQRIDNVIAQADAAKKEAQQAADAARKAAASFAFYSFFSLLIGAFIASAAAALGGKERDETKPARA